MIYMFKKEMFEYKIYNIIPPRTWGGKFFAFKLAWAGNFQIIPRNTI